jgi:hypothetical protein
MIDRGLGWDSDGIESFEYTFNLAAREQRGTVPCGIKQGDYFSQAQQGTLELIGCR